MFGIFWLCNILSTVFIDQRDVHGLMMAPVYRPDSSILFQNRACNTDFQLNTEFIMGKKNRKSKNKPAEKIDNIPSKDVPINLEEKNGKESSQDNSSTDAISESAKAVVDTKSENISRQTEDSPDQEEKNNGTFTDSIRSKTSLNPAAKPFVSRHFQQDIKQKEHSLLVKNGTPSYSSREKNRGEHARSQIRNTKSDMPKPKPAQRFSPNPHQQLGDENWDDETGQEELRTSEKNQVSVAKSQTGNTRSDMPKPKPAQRFSPNCNPHQQLGDENWDDETAQEELRTSVKNPVSVAKHWDDETFEPTHCEEKRSFSVKNERVSFAKGWKDVVSKKAPYKEEGSSVGNKRQSARFSGPPQISNDERFTGKTTERQTGGHNKNRKTKSELDDYYDSFTNELRNVDHIDFKIVREEAGDLFEVDKTYSLAHCVAEDMNMGSGIAIRFRHEFKNVDNLLNQRQASGGLAILKDGSRFIYYLVTKRYSYGKPTNETLFSSLYNLKKHMVENDVTKLAVPKLGCGLDRLEWSTVKRMLEFMFADTAVEEILVCNYIPSDEDSSPQKHKNCRLTNVNYPIENIEDNTLIIYFSSEDKEITKEMEKLDEKFNFLNSFRQANTRLGDIAIFDKHSKFFLCGCIAKKGKRDHFDYTALQKCLNAIQKENRSWKFEFVGFQAVDDPDFSTNHKIINLARNTFRNVDVYVCWPGQLERQMPITNRENLNSSQNESKEQAEKKDSGYSKKYGRKSDSSENWRDGCSGTKKTDRLSLPQRKS